MHTDDPFEVQVTLKVAAGVMRLSDLVDRNRAALNANAIARMLNG